MAVAFDAVGPSAAGAGSTTSPLTWSHTNAGSVLVVGIAVGPSVGNPATWTTAVTYGGVAMTICGARVNSNAGTSGFVELWKLRTADGLPTGANNVSVTVGNLGGGVISSIVGGSTSWTGADNIANYTTNSGQNAASITVASATGNAAVSAICSGSTCGTLNQTARWLNNFSAGSAAGNAAMRSAAGAATVNFTMASAADWWGYIAADVTASGGAAAAAPVPIWHMHAIDRRSTR